MKSNNKHIEASAVSLIRDFFDKKNIYTQLSENDKTRYTDGSISISSKNYDVQIKGTKKQFSTQSIEYKYFFHSIRNFLIYIIVDRIDDGITSKNWNAYYKIFNLDDIKIGMQNKSNTSVNKFVFKKLSNIPELIHDVNNAYDEFVLREQEGISPGVIFSLQNIGEAKLNIAFDLSKNLVDIKNTELKSVVITNHKDKEAQIKVKQGKYTISFDNIVSSSTIKIPNINSTLPVMYNSMTKCLKVEHKDLIIVLDGKSCEGRISIERLSINPFFSDDLLEYIEVLKHLKTHFSFHDIDDFLEKIIEISKESQEFKKLLIENGLFDEKYNNDEVLICFHEILYDIHDYFTSEKSLTATPIENHDKHVIIYKDNAHCKIVSDFPTGTCSREDGSLLKGVLACFLHEGLMKNFNIGKAWRNCITFDYLHALELDRENLATHYLDWEVSQIVFHYLLIYWENNHSQEMLETLYHIIASRSLSTTNDILKVNVLQIKKILEIPLNEEEIKYLGERFSQDEMINHKLCYSVLLDRKLESLQLYNKLGKKDEFQHWPIYYLYEKLFNESSS